MLPVYLSLASHFHGGAFFSAPRLVRNAVFALPYAFFFHHPIFHALSMFGLTVPPEIFGGLLSFALAFIGVNIGHDNFWMMGTVSNVPDNNWVGNIVARLGLTRDSLAWCTVGMAIKGFVMGLGTLNPLVVIGHTVAFPLAYYIGDRTRWNTNASEYLSGFFDGLVLLFVILLQFYK